MTGDHEDVPPTAPRFRLVPSKRGVRVEVQAVIAGNVVARDLVDPRVAADRKRCLDALRARWPMIDDVDEHGETAAEQLDRDLVQRGAAHASDIADDHAQSSSAEQRESKATRVVNLAVASAELFHDPDGDAYADVIVDGHRETHALRASGFRKWLCKLFYDSEGSAISAQVRNDALDLLESHACYGSESFPVFVRVAATATATYLDLGNPEWSAVEVDALGWRIVTHPPVRFRRSQGMRELPTPIRGGSIEVLRPFLSANDGTDDDDDRFTLDIAWLVSAHRGRPPFPILALSGEQGTGKSTKARMMRMLTDPAKVLLRAAPKDETDLAVYATHAWALGFDNLSSVPEWLADGLCRVATGGGFGKRKLYSDSDETQFDITRPILLNGIDDLCTRPDLGDRAVVLHLPTIPDDKRKSEAQLWREFEAVRPMALGALLDAVAGSIKDFETTRAMMTVLPRMADFAIAITAAEARLGWEAGTFMRAFTGNKAELVEVELGAEPAAVALLGFMEKRKDWTGTATSLLAELNAIGGPDQKQSREWPTSGHALAMRLRRLAPALRSVGISIVRDRDRKKRTMIITRMDPGDSPKDAAKVRHGRHTRHEPKNAAAQRDGCDAPQAGVTHSRPAGDGSVTGANPCGDERDGCDAESRDSAAAETEEPDAMPAGAKSDADKLDALLAEPSPTPTQQKAVP